MYPFTQLPKPLRPAEFYVLLALSRRQLHRYAMKSEIHKDSLGSVAISATKLYPLIAKLQDEALIELVAVAPAGKHVKDRQIFAISSHGVIRLREELTRLNHAIEIAQSANLFDPPKLSPDIQRLLLDLEVSAERR